MGVQKPSDIIGLSLSKTKAKFKDEKKMENGKKKKKNFILELKLELVKTFSRKILVLILIGGGMPQKFLLNSERRC